MAIALSLSSVKLKFLEWAFPKASEVEIETLEIMMDLEQMSTLLASFDDIRRGHLVSASDAFGDL